MDWVLVAMLGVLAGTIAGLFGVGGGTIFVPTLTLLLGLSQLHAEATSLLAIVPVAMLGSWQQRRDGNIEQRDALIIGGASVVTAVLGSLLADVAPERVLKVGFAVLLLYVAWRLFRSTLSRGTA
ncbi:MAG: sulfite exporter TauE/SafE family protein [Actinobacteria bacterium]|nr:sulfite exporter TauE/SafE family protein [Thermoleophilia bacterium]MCB9011573.1 sulfite exporter TauE/SafE family protein [Actinomycetota bacterium]